jgi:ATP-dependent Clp protease protease subunit
MISGLNEQLRRIVLSGDIRQDMAAQFLEQITAFECIDHDRSITIYIDTYGGSIDSALFMYDVLKSCYCPIVTIGIGKVMSAGVLLLAAGDKNKRYITENTRVMIHEVSGGTVGTVSEMDVSVKESKRMQRIYAKLLSDETGKSKTQITKDMKADYYMSAKEAVEYGIADLIVPVRSDKIKRKKKATRAKQTKK